MRFASGLAQFATIKIVTAFAILGFAELGFAEVTNPKQSPGVADLVAKVAPAVVSITTTNPYSRPSIDPIRGNDDSRKSTNISGGFGSGVIVSPDGYILTNNHVVEGAAGIIVTREDVQKDYQATVIGTDPIADLALIKIQETDLPYLQFAEAGSYRVGDGVLAIGNPWGFGQSVSMGIISAIDRALSPSRFEDYIQMDAAINHGNSGGALVNLNGELVGINTWFYQQNKTDVPSGVNFAIAAPLAKAVMEELKENGKVKRSYIGAELEQLTPGFAANVGIQSNVRGAVVALVMQNSPAERAGLRSGDVITELDGKPVRSSLELERSIIFSPPGNSVEMTIYRDGKQLTVKVVLEEKPPDKNQQESRDQ
jgi:S1-C subfamily serine protease